MIIIKGKHNQAVCFTDELEASARKQIETLCDQEAFAECKIRIMPDVHAGIGCTCLLYTSPSPRDRTRSRMPSSA